MLLLLANVLVQQLGLLAERNRRIAWVFCERVVATALRVLLGRIGASGGPVQRTEQPELLAVLLSSRAQSWRMVLALIVLLVL